MRVDVIWYLSQIFVIIKLYSQGSSIECLVSKENGFIRMFDAFLFPQRSVEGAYIPYCSLRLDTVDSNLECGKF